MADLEKLRERYLAERHRYEALAFKVRSVLEAATQELGLVCRFEHRAKAVDSLLKKAIRKSYESPYDQIRDKAGVRVIAPFYADVEEVIGVVSDDRFLIDHFENKKSALAYNELGYLGVHFEIRLRPHLLSEKEGKLEGLTCEIQLHSAAQTAWADASHDLVYKAPPGAVIPEEHQRSVYRLVAFVEVFDEEADRVRKAMMSMEGSREARMLLALERPFYRLSATPFDSELSVQVLTLVAELYSEEEIRRFPGLIDDFVREREEKLQSLFADYRDDERRNPLLFQPETIAVFERLETSPLALRAAWSRAFPEQLLEGLADIWGVAV